MAKPDVHFLHHPVAQLSTDEAKIKHGVVTFEIGDDMAEYF
jgi:hypothetical protein